MHRGKSYPITECFHSFIICLLVLFFLTLPKMTVGLTSDSGRGSVIQSELSYWFRFSSFISFPVISTVCVAASDGLTDVDFKGAFSCWCFPVFICADTIFRHVIVRRIILIPPTLHRLFKRPNGVLGNPLVCHIRSINRSISAIDAVCQACVKSKICLKFPYFTLTSSLFCNRHGSCTATNTVRLHAPVYSWSYWDGWVPHMHQFMIWSERLWVFYCVKLMVDSHRGLSPSLEEPHSSSFIRWKILCTRLAVDWGLMRYDTTLAPLDRLPFSQSLMAL